MSESCGWFSLLFYLLRMQWLSKKLCFYDVVDLVLITKICLCRFVLCVSGVGKRSEMIGIRSISAMADLISFHGFREIALILCYALNTPGHYYLEHQSLCDAVIMIRTLDDSSIRPNCVMSLNQSCWKMMRDSEFICFVFFLFVFWRVLFMFFFIFWEFCVFVFILAEYCLVCILCVLNQYSRQLNKNRVIFFFSSFFPHRYSFRVKKAKLRGSHHTGIGFDKKRQIDK